MTSQIRCHYDVLSVPRDAEVAAIKKSHRRLALQHHPDKNVGKTEEERRQSAAEFKLVQVAYECLSDPVERKWYDEHRDMILRGGLDGRGGPDEGDGSSFLFDVMPFQYAGCYDGYDDDDSESFYSVYNEVFDKIFQGEKNGYISEGNIDVEKMPNFHLSTVRFGYSTSNWEAVLAFYNSWEGFMSSLSFAWEDTYHLNDIHEAPNRRMRRLMEDDNRKKRKAAKKERVEDICALVRFVKKRDPRVRVQREKSLRELAQKEAKMKKDAARRKKEIAAAKEEWRAEAERTMAEQEAADLDAGRIRLADLDSDEDYDYGGKRGRRKKAKRKGMSKIQKKTVQIAQNYADDSRGEISDFGDQDSIIKENVIHGEMEIESSVTPPDASGINREEPAGKASCEGIEINSTRKTSEDPSIAAPNSWRCECCRKDFKSQKQFENHERSKKHKESLKKYEKKMKKKVIEDALSDMMKEMDGDHGTGAKSKDNLIFNDEEKKPENDASIPASIHTNEQDPNVHTSGKEYLLDGLNGSCYVRSHGNTSEESSEEEPDLWRCECCKKDFKSQKQFENHERSKKHKETLKKYRKKLQRG